MTAVDSLAPDRARRTRWARWARWARGSRTTALRLVKAELMKIRTTRSWWFFLIGFTVFTVLALTENGIIRHYQLYPQPDPGEREQALARAAQAHTPAGVAAIAVSMMTSGQFLSVLIVMLLGIHIATSEFAQRTVVATFLTVPRRARVVMAKLAAALCLATLCWLIATVIAVVTTPFFLLSQHVSTSLADWVVVRSVLLSLLTFALWAVFGVGLGAVLRGQVATVVAGIGVYAGGFAVVELLFHMIYNFYHQGWVLGLPVIAPAVASQVMITSGRAFQHAPPQWVGAVIMAGYAVALAVAGTALIRCRDVT